jgi:hypothetical protein
METYSFSETDRRLIAELIASNNRLAAAIEGQKAERVFSCKEAAAIIGVCPQTISRYLAQKRIKKGERGGKVGIPESEILKLKPRPKPQ